MSKNLGTLVTAPIRPNDSIDKIATAWSVEVKGGLHHYATKAERDSIIEERRSWGMLCVVYNDGTATNNGTWQLKYNNVDSDINNNLNWVKFSSGGSGGAGGGGGYWIDPVKSILSAQPAGPSDGDRYILGSSPSGPAWGSFTKDTVVEWNDAASIWQQTAPLGDMSVRVTDQQNAIYRYNSVSSLWFKENLNQVIRISATSSNAYNYTATSDKVYAYNTDLLYVVRFATANAGSTMSVNINGLGSRVVYQQTNYGTASLTGKDLSTAVDYTMTYDGTSFRLNKPTVDPAIVKYRILPNDKVTVPAYQEYFVYGDLEVNGILNVDPLGKVVVVNGALNVNGGTVSNYSNVQLITLATTTTNLQVRKNSQVLTLSSGVPTNVVHNLNSYDITVTVWDENTLQTVAVTVDRDSLNDITITSATTVSARVVVMG